MYGLWTNVWVYMCVQVFVCRWRPKFDVRNFWFLFTVYLETGSVNQTQGLKIHLVLSVNCSRALVSSSRGWNFRWCSSPPCLYIGSGDLSSGLQVCYLQASASAPGVTSSATLFCFNISSFVFSYTNKLWNESHTFPLHSKYLEATL